MSEAEAAVDGGDAGETAEDDRVSAVGFQVVGDNLEDVVDFAGDVMATEYPI